MHWKEKEKLWLNRVKDICTIDGWQFKNFFIYKQIDELYFTATFYASRNDNILSGWLEYKTYNIDNVFWDIVNIPANKKKPLSFRSEAAFSISAINIWEYEKNISNEKDPGKEIIALFKEICKKADTKVKKTRTAKAFHKDLEKDEELNSAGIITSLIEQKKYNTALVKIKEYKKQDISSGFGFGNKDFYDLAKSHCLKHSN